MRHSVVPSGEELVPELREMLKDESRTFPVKPVIVIVFLYALTLAAAFARGGKGVRSFLGIAPCSDAYWLFTVGFTAVCILLMVMTTFMLVSSHYHRKAVNYPYEPDDMLWTYTASNNVTFVSLTTGLICGMLGLTGGVFLGPALLMLNVKTEVANATCGLVVCFSSSVAFVQYAIAGMVTHYGHGIWYAGWAAAGALLGVTLIESRMRASGNASTAVYILALVLAVATALIPVYGAMHVVDLVATKNWSFGTFC